MQLMCCLNVCVCLCVCVCVCVYVCVHVCVYLNLQFFWAILHIALTAIKIYIFPFHHFEYYTF